MMLNDISEQCRMGIQAASRLNTFCRRIVYEAMIVNGGPIGGPGDIVCVFPICALFLLFFYLG